MNSSVRFVAIGDSFTEGVGDELPDGSVRGWADLAAQGWAAALDEPIDYANLAIRGKLARAILDEQLDAALALKPTHLSFNGGGNDILRPGVSAHQIAAMFHEVVQACDRAGVQLIVLSGANPSGGLPLRGLIQRRGDELSKVVLAVIEDRPDIIRALNWPDRVLAQPEFWSPDRLHMGPRGHHRVAARVLDALGVGAPTEWWNFDDEPPTHLPAWQYYRSHVGPWLHRRVTKRSSGDGREPKYAQFVRVNPRPER